MAVVRWIFQDPVTLESHTFAVNPAESDTPGFRRNIQYENTSAPDGKTLVFEGRAEVQKLNFSGSIFTEAELDVFMEWAQRGHQIRVTDDLGREFYIVIVSFNPRRQRAIHSPFKHTYEIEATIVDWP